MRHALEQGDGFLVITGHSGTGKTTLVEDFLAGLKQSNVATASLNTTQLEGEDLLRMVGYVFDLDVEGLDKASLLQKIDRFFRRQQRTLLIIDEAQNLSPAALEEVRLLTNLTIKSRPLLQVFLVGQERLRQQLHLPQIEQLHQRLMAACDLEPLDLTETREYVLHRLNCAGWRGDPEINTAAFVLICRFSQGLPRYISKLCARLFLHGAVEQRHLLGPEDVMTVVHELQEELLLPLDTANDTDQTQPAFDLHEPLASDPLSQGWQNNLTDEERTFIEHTPEMSEISPAMSASIPAVLKQQSRAESETTVSSDSIARRESATGPSLEVGFETETGRTGGKAGGARAADDRYGINNRHIVGFAAAVSVVLVAGGYALGVYHAKQQLIPSLGSNSPAKVEEALIPSKRTADNSASSYAKTVKTFEAVGLLKPAAQQTPRDRQFLESETQAPEAPKEQLTEPQLPTDDGVELVTGISALDPAPDLVSAQTLVVVPMPLDVRDSPAVVDEQAFGGGLSPAEDTAVATLDESSGTRQTAEIRAADTESVGDLVSIKDSPVPIAHAKALSQQEETSSDQQRAEATGRPPTDQAVAVTQPKQPPQSAAVTRTDATEPVGIPVPTEVPPTPLTVAEAGDPQEGPTSDQQRAETNSRPPTDQAVAVTQPKQPPQSAAVVRTDATEPAGIPVPTEVPLTLLTVAEAGNQQVDVSNDQERAEVVSELPGGKEEAVAVPSQPPQAVDRGQQETTKATRYGQAADLPRTQGGGPQGEPTLTILGNETGLTSGVAPPATAELPSIPDDLSSATTDDALPPTVLVSDNAQIEEWLQLGEQAIAHNRLQFPKQRSARHYYQQILVLDPENQDARNGMQRIASRYGQLASRLAKKQEYAKAQLYIDRGLSVVPNHGRLLVLQGEVRRQEAAMLKQQRQERLRVLQARESRALAEAARLSKTREPKPRGFFGNIQTLFNGDETPGLDQLIPDQDQ